MEPLHGSRKDVKKLALHDNNSNPLTKKLIKKNNPRSKVLQQIPTLRATFYHRTMQSKRTNPKISNIISPLILNPSSQKQPLRFYNPPKLPSSNPFQKRNFPS